MATLTAAQKSFIDKVSKMVIADKYAKSICPSLTIAQAILESAWGTSGLTKQANALFGIKCGKSWTGAYWTGKTKEEYTVGKITVITDSFRAYKSWEESIEDHGRFLTVNSRYAKVIGEMDYKKACKYIKDAGYATDSNYTVKLLALIEGYNLHKYDSVGEVKAAEVKVEQSTSTKTYTVKKGDTLTRIARENKTTITQLAALNNIKDVNRILIGQIIKLP